jgi:hypothetical protein
MQLQQFLYLDLLCFDKQKNVRHSRGRVLCVHVVERVAVIGVDKDLSVDRVLVVGRVVYVLVEVVCQREHRQAVAEHNKGVVGVGARFPPRRLFGVGEHCRKRSLHGNGHEQGPALGSCLRRLVQAMFDEVFEVGVHVLIIR